MKIDVSSIVKTNGASLDISYNEILPGLNEVESDFLFNGTVDFKGNVVNASGILKMDGFLKAVYTCKCSRCLKDINGELNIKIRENFLEGNKDTNTEAYTYDDNYILIDDVLKDNIILNLPVKQVCDEKCKGLCPRCGTDLNEKGCSCTDEVINPRMEILKNFFNN